MKKWIGFLTIAAVFFSCGGKKTEVDTLIFNATIYTIDSTMSIQQAMVLDKGKIVELGTRDELTRKYQAKHKVDLQGKFVYPGLIDPHSHFYGLGQSLVTVDLRNSISENDMIEKVKDFYSPEKPDQAKYSSVQGRGWDQNLWQDKKFPTNKVLNKLFPDIPVFLVRIDGHAALVNQKALDMASINEKTIISGGEIIKENGVPTGVLIDNAVDLVSRILPSSTIEEQKQSLLKAEAECLKWGLTSVSDAGLEKETIELYKEMHEKGELKIRIYAMANHQPGTLGWLLKEGPVHTEKLHVQSVKYYMDGAMGSRGACLLEHYADQPGHKGFLLSNPDSLKQLAQLLFDKNIQLNVHCIGDSANRVVLKIMAGILGDDVSKRWRIEHMQLIHPSDLEIVSKCKIIPSMQPTHATSDAPWVKDRIGERVKYAYALRSCLKSAGLIALGTDFPVEHVNPFYTLHTAVKRTTPEGTGFPWLKEEALTMEETIKGMTIWAAYAQFEENEKGSLEPGKFADFIVLNEDIFKTNKDLSALVPSYVYLDGKLVAGSEITSD